MLGDAGRAGLLPQQAASAREGLCSLQVMDAAWTTYPRVPCVLRKTACLLHREFSGTRLFLCTDPNVRKAALVLAVLCGLRMEGGPGVCASFMPDASQPVRLLCRICVQGSPGVDGSLDEPGLSGVHGALVSAFGGVLCQGFTAPISVSLSTQSTWKIIFLEAAQYFEVEEGSSGGWRASCFAASRLRFIDIVCDRFV